MYAEILLLRLIHVLGGIFWVGSGLFNSLFLFPALAASGPASGQVLAGLQRRRLFAALPIVALLTIASGLRLMWIASAGFSPAYLASPVGRTFVGGATAATLAFVLSLLVVRPAAMRAARLGATLAGAPEGERAGLAAELARVQRRSVVANAAAVLLVTLAAAGMAVGRYVR